MTERTFAANYSSRRSPSGSGTKLGQNRHFFHKVRNQDLSFSQASCCSHEGTPAETSAAGEPCTIQSDSTFRPLVALAQLDSNNRPGARGKGRQIAEQGGADLWLARQHRTAPSPPTPSRSVTPLPVLIWPVVEYDDRDREVGTQTTFSRCPIAESSLPRSACPSAFCALPLTFSNQPQCPLTPSQERRCSTAAWPKAAYSTWLDDSAADSSGSTATCTAAAC